MNVNQAPATLVPATTTFQLIENLWIVFAHQINSGACSYIEMPINIKAVLRDEGLMMIANRFRNLIQAPTTVFEDPDRAVIQIMPSYNNHGHQEIIPEARDPKVTATKKAKVARPANAFILYRQHHHPLLKAKHPDMHNNEISVILGKQWKNEKESTKSRFINMAKQLKARHQIEHPEYQYQPRKPSQKKRRMTQRKKAALAEASASQPNSSLNQTSELIDLTLTEDTGTASVFQFPETVGGNAMVELGDAELDEETLKAMLEQYNESRPPIQTQANRMMIEASPPVIYAELAEEAQGQKNFYANFNSFNGNESIAADMEAMMKEKEEEYSNYADVDPKVIAARFDEEQEYLFNAEVNRMCHWNDEPLPNQA
ncbi:hypothetical protein ACLMJK_009013 [Lecanora helva]